MIKILKKIFSISLMINFERWLLGCVSKFKRGKKNFNDHEEVIMMHTWGRLCLISAFQAFWSQAWFSSTAEKTHLVNNALLPPLFLILLLLLSLSLAFPLETKSVKEKFWERVYKREDEPIASCSCLPINPQNHALRSLISFWLKINLVLN